jgi:hypothetical protein
MKRLSRPKGFFPVPSLKSHLPLLVFGPVVLFIIYRHEQLGDRGTGYQGWLEAARLSMHAPDLKAFLLQAYVAVTVELFCLYSILHTRSAEIHVFSHVRLVCATILTGVIGAAFFHVVIWVLSGRSLLIYLLIALPASAVATVSGMFQAAVVVAFDAMGRDPIAKDLAREPKMGKIGDFNSWIIRRWGQFIFFWFLLLPGLALNLPAPPLAVTILAGLVVIPGARTLAVSAASFMES